jgi:hypothetical protein
MGDWKSGAKACKDSRPEIMVFTEGNGKQSGLNAG